MVKHSRRRLSRGFFERMVVAGRLPGSSFSPALAKSSLMVVKGEDDNNIQASTELQTK